MVKSSKQKTKYEWEAEAETGAKMEMAASKLLAELGVGRYANDLDHKVKVAKVFEEFTGIPLENVECMILIAKVHDKEIKGMRIKGGMVGDIQEVEVLEMLLAARLVSQRAAIQLKVLENNSKKGN